MDSTRAHGIGCKVPDVATAIEALREKGVAFNMYKGFSQDELGIMTPPGSAVKVAWFNGLDGRVLSATNA